MTKDDKKILLLGIIVLTMFFILFFLITSCTITDKNIINKTVDEMIAEEIGIAVAQKNPDMINQVEPYYKTMFNVYEQGDNENLAILIHIGLEYILQKYAGDNLDIMRIKSKIIRLMTLSNLDTSILDIPDLKEFKDIDPEYIISITNAFLGGMRMVKK